MTPDRQAQQLHARGGGSLNKKDTVELAPAEIIFENEMLARLSLPLIPLVQEIWEGGSCHYCCCYPKQK